MAGEPMRVILYAPLLWRDEGLNELTAWMGRGGRWTNVSASLVPLWNAYHEAELYGEASHIQVSDEGTEMVFAGSPSLTLQNVADQLGHILRIPVVLDGLENVEADEKHPG